jgi:Collagen triple helix repeat (20 copies)
VVFNIVRSPARPRACPAKSVRVSWNAKGSTGGVGAAGAKGSNGTNGVDGAAGSTGLAGADGADGVDGADGSTGLAGADGADGVDGAAGSTGPAGADGTNGVDGADGSTGPAGADGTNGVDGSTGPAGLGSMVSSGVFTLHTSNGWADTNAYLPLSGYLGTQVVAPQLDMDAMVTEAEHTSVEQVIAHDQTLTDMYVNFGSTTDLGGRHLQVQVIVLVSSGGTHLLVPVAGCTLDVVGNGPTSKGCAWQGEQSVQLTAGDVAVVYVHAFAGGWPPDSSVDIYGTVALTT